jgi:hypothetical protein
MYRISLLLMLFSAVTITGQTILSGNIGGKTFKPSGNPWIVTENISVEKDKAVLIEAGCVFLFKQFTGIEVHGELVVEGSKKAFVVFTSFNDSKHNLSTEVLPNPFDWNGIVIHEEAKITRFSYATVSFSVFGIKSLKSDVIIENSTFRQNGQFHFTVLGEIQPVQEDYPYSYGNKNEEKYEKSVRPLKIASVATGSAGVICGAVSGVFWNEYRKAWHDAEYSKNSADIADANNREEKALKNAGILSGISVTLLSTAVVLYIVDYKRNTRKRVSRSPVFGPEYNGIVFHSTF